MKKISIFVVSHKKLNLDSYPNRNIIYVGSNHKSKSDKKRIFVDSVAKSISKLNPYYCELTALYWVWKNYPKTEYICFEHYRRNFYHNFKLATPNFLLEKLSKYDFLHAIPLKHITTVEKFWKRHEGKYLFDILDSAIKKVSPSYYDDWLTITRRHKMTYCNIFACRWDLFNKYMNFIFPILNETYKNISVMDKKQQDRSIGFMAERLFDVFIKHNNCTHKSMLVYFNKKCKNNILA